jgi:hypothetical protein
LHGAGPPSFFLHSCAAPTGQFLPEPCPATPRARPAVRLSHSGLADRDQAGCGDRIPQSGFQAGSRRKGPRRIFWLVVESLPPAEHCACIISRVWFCPLLVALPGRLARGAPLIGPPNRTHSGGCTIRRHPRQCCGASAWIRGCKPCRRLVRDIPRAPAGHQQGSTRAEHRGRERQAWHPWLAGWLAQEKPPVCLTVSCLFPLIIT